MKHIASAQVRARFTAMSDSLDALASKQLAGNTSTKTLHHVCILDKEEHERMASTLQDVAILAKVSKYANVEK
jgi:hypothetical protein